MKLEKAVLGAGCFWHVEEFFSIIKGVMGGVSEQGIFQAIQQQAGLSNAQMQTLVNKLFNTVYVTT